MALADDFRECIVCLDVKRARKIWAVANPGLPQPETDAQAEITLHAARLSMKSLPPRLKEYSRRWLEERAALPRHVYGVGISVKAGSPNRAEMARAMEAAMAQAVLDALQDGVSLETDADEVSRRMIRARDRA